MHLQNRSLSRYTSSRANVISREIAMKKYLLLFVSLFIFIGLAPSYAAVDNCQTSCTLATGTDKMKVTYQIKGKNLIVNMSAKTTGWVAVGFGASHKMKDATIVMGYIDKSGDPILSNEFGIATTKHLSQSKLGGKPEGKLISGGLKNGITTIRFSLPLITTDPKYGKTFKSGNPITVILAYGPNNAKNFTAYHAFRTEKTLTLPQFPTPAE